MSSGAKGGHMGVWQSCDAVNLPNQCFGQIYIEQPIRDTTALVSTSVGRLIVTKYFIFKGMANVSGVPIQQDP